MVGNGLKISELIKHHPGVKKMAEDLGVSRPTLYKYMNSYDRGDTHLVPPDIVDRFDNILSGADASDSKDTSASIKERLVNLRKVFVECNNHQFELIEQLDSYEKEYRSDPSPELQSTIDNIQRSLWSLDLQQKKRRDTIRELSGRLSAIDGTPGSALDFLENYEVSSSHYIENGRCMVVHDGDQAPGRRFFLHLYAFVGIGFSCIGTYDTVEGRNFFMIDDAILSAPLYYRIVGYEPDQDGDYDFHGIRYSAVSGLDTGMCEISHRK